MRVFQNSGVYPAYLPKLNELAPASASHDEQLSAFLDDRYGACHILAPVYDGSAPAFYANGDHVSSQRAWASERGLPASSSLDDILLAQIEEHRAEVLYNTHPMRFGNAFLSRLPGSVRFKIAWRAAPSAGGDFHHHDLMVCNFPSILKSYEAEGMRTAYFAPSHDPVMDEYAAGYARELDVFFAGGYSRHHARRAETLESVAELASEYSVEFRLDRSRLVRLAESPVGSFGPLAKHRRPLAVRRVSRPPVFGRELYSALARAKVVLNGAVDMATADRGNMRCWEALGCGALLVSDAGNYPDGMANGVTLMTYESPASARATVQWALNNPLDARELAEAGRAMVRSKYSKSAQWAAFTKLVADRC